MTLLFEPLKSLIKRIGQGVNQSFKTWTKPAKPSQDIVNLAKPKKSKCEILLPTSFNLVKL